MCRAGNIPASSDRGERATWLAHFLQLPRRPARAFRETKAIQRALTSSDGSEHRTREKPRDRKQSRRYGRRQRRTNAHALEPSCRSSWVQTWIDRLAFSHKPPGMRRLVERLRTRSWGDQGKILRSKWSRSVDGAYGKHVHVPVRESKARVGLRESRREKSGERSGDRTREQPLPDWPRSGEKQATGEALYVATSRLQVRRGNRRK